MRFVFLTVCLWATASWGQLRQPISTSLTISQTEIFGGAISATISAAPPDPYTPTVLNGVPQSGVADLRLKVGLNYLAEAQLGGRNVGEFVPYQRVTVRVENLSTLDPDNSVEFDLVPAVSAEEGWHYASEVRLPPQAPDEDLLADLFRVSVVSISLGAVALHSDAQPPSKLFRPLSPTDVTLLFDDEVDLSLARSLRHGVLEAPARLIRFAGWSTPPEACLKSTTQRRARRRHHRGAAPAPRRGAPRRRTSTHRAMQRERSGEASTTRPSGFAKHALLLALLFATACKVEPLFTEVPRFTQLLLLQDRPVSGGAMLATLSLERPDAINFPTLTEAPLPGGNESAGANVSDLYLQLELRYAAAVQGGQKKGDL